MSRALALVAILITYSDFVRKGFYPLIVLLQIVPKVAVAPLFVVWFGLGDLSRLLLSELEEIGLDPFPLATGGRGIHLVVPLDRTADFDTVRSFARERLDAAGEGAAIAD